MTWKRRMNKHLARASRKLRARLRRTHDRHDWASRCQGHRRAWDSWTEEDRTVEREAWKSLSLTTAGRWTAPFSPVVASFMVSWPYGGFGGEHR